MTSRLSVSILLSAVLLFFPGTIPLLAQDSSSDEPTLQDVQQWVAGQEEYSGNINTLYTILGNALNSPPPRGQVATPFEVLAADFSALQPVMHKKLQTVTDWENGTDTSTLLLEAYREFFPMEDCEIPAMTLPDSLDAAATQIEAAAAELVATFHSIFTPEQVAFLRNNHLLITGLIQLYPFGGAFTDESMATLVQYLDILDRADHTALLCATGHWSQFLESPWRGNLQALMAAHPDAGNEIIAQYYSPFGRIVFGGTAGLNLLAGNILFIADAGGNDIYGLRTQDAWSGLPQLIMDFGGNDIYDSLEPGGYASAVGTVSLLADYAGNDRYHGRGQTQGFGLFGLGLLLDVDGDDEYIAGAMAQGFSMFGAGMLLDLAGNDRYQVESLGQGAGMTEGVGILVDIDGADSYLATGLVPTSYGTPGLSDTWSQGIGVGVRFVSPGGVGILVDHAGNDSYTAGSFSQGGGYFFGIGLFNDSGGDEIYLGSRYNFGWGAHMGIGYFREEGGDDHYRTRQYVASGLSWDLSLVLFEDLAGDDLYEVGSFSLAASAHRSIVLFRDYEGNDTYLNILPARTDVGPPNLSLFLDTGSGENTFNPATNDTACSSNNNLGIMLVMPALHTLDDLECMAE